MNNENSVNLPRVARSKTVENKLKKKHTDMTLENRSKIKVVSES